MNRHIESVWKVWKELYELDERRDNEPVNLNESNTEYISSKNSKIQFVGGLAQNEVARNYYTISEDYPIRAKENVPEKKENMNINKNNRNILEKNSNN